MKLALKKLWIIILWIVLIYAAQHFVRDILSDIFGIRNSFTDFGHRESSNAVWCGKYCKWTTFPIEIFYIFTSLCLLKAKKFGVVGWLMMIVIIPVLLQYLDLIIK